MKTSMVALLVACFIGLSWAQDCSSNIKQFHECLEASEESARQAEKAKFEGLKAKFEACYTDNGCTPPQKGGNHTFNHTFNHGSNHTFKHHSASGSSSSSSGEKQQGNDTRKECFRALEKANKQQFEQCLSEVGINITQHEPKNKSRKGEHEKRERGHKFDHKAENKALESCAKKQEVRACQKALFEQNKPTDAEAQAKFEQRCNATQTCLTQLGAQCEAQLQKFKQATCKCGKQLRANEEQTRSSIASCQSLPTRRPEGKNETQSQETCEEKNYCKLGFAALKQDLEARFNHTRTEFHKKQ